MKKIFFILPLFFAFFTIDVSAQLHTLGLDRSIGGSGQFRDTRKKEVVKDEDIVKAAADKMEAQLSLDGFQKAAVLIFIEDYKNAIVAIDALEIPDEGKKEKMEIEKDKMESKILSVLNKEQAVKFEELKTQKGKKSKKK